MFRSARTLATLGLLSVLVVLPSAAFGAHGVDAQQLESFPSPILVAHPWTVPHGSLPTSQPISPEFWGLNIEPTHPFNASDALLVNATPVSYLRYPGGNYAEQMNYTSGVITLDDGSTTTAVNTVDKFVASCALIRCHAILQLPAEINSTSTVAYYVSYVVQTLAFRPAYWELGNAPASWKHVGAPWSTWASGTTGNSTPMGFANEVHRLIAAIRVVDASTPILALGSGMVPTFDRSWIDSLLRVDGPLLAGVSVHDYPGWTGNSGSTLADFFGGLTATWALPNLIAADEGYLRNDCSNCTTQLFVSEANANYGGGTFDHFLASFNDTLFLAAEVTQTLRAGAHNIDWFDFQSNYPGTMYPQGGSPGPNYYLFSELLTTLGNATLATTLPGPATFYSAATASGSGQSILAVNVNLTNAVTVNLTGAGFLPGTNVTEKYWSTGMSRPTELRVPSSSTPTLAALSVASFSSGAVGKRNVTPAQFPVAYVESGLTPGTRWTVTSNGVPLTSTGSSIGFYEPNGTYGFSVGPVSGFAPTPRFGQVVVDGRGQSVAIVFAVIPPPSPLGVVLSATLLSFHLGGTTIISANVSGGNAPYSYSYLTLPPGCVSANSSSVRCTPTAVGNFSVNVTVADPQHDLARGSITVEVLPAQGTSEPHPPGSSSSAGFWPPLFLGAVLAVESIMAVAGALALREAAIQNRLSRR